MEKRNDPRWWAKVALSGGVSTDSMDLETFDHLAVVHAGKRMLAKGVKTCRPKARARRFTSVAGLVAQHTQALGEKLAARR